MTEPSLTAYHVHVFSDIELWCFSFVTLFNLQGTRSVPCPVRNIHYLTTGLSVCQVLFSTFFKIFFRTRLAGACRSEAWLSYHISLALSSTFFRFFSKSFSYSTAVAPFARELDYFTTASCFCQALFSLSTKLFSKALEHTRLSATARLIYHTPAPLSIPFFLFFHVFFRD